MKRLLAIVVLTACATAKAPPPPALTQLPQAAVDVMCARLRAEGMTSEVRVVNMTQPIVTEGSLHALAEIAFRTAPGNPELVRKLMATPLMPVEVPSQTCISRFITPKEAERATDVMILQFSSPFLNPFGKENGTLVRLSLGGEASTWYWIPLVYRKDHWLAGAPSNISVME